MKRAEPTDTTSPRSDVSSNRSENQQRRLCRFGASQSVDIHCHVLPGLDDGAQTLDEALDLCRALVEDGVTHVVATPHQFGRYEGRNQAPQIRQAVADLTVAIERSSIPITVLPGADVRLDERLATLLDQDVVMTVADHGRYLLLELPSQTFIDPAPLIAQLASRQITIILTHPERHDHLVRHPDAVARWMAKGALIQLTAASLLGECGRPAERSAWRWLSSPTPYGRAGTQVIIASDAHNLNTRPPRLSAAIDAIAERLGHTMAKRVCLENPLTILKATKKTSP